MPLIMPIRDLRKTNEISEVAHREQQPIFITKNGYSDFVVMSSELYDKIARENRLDQAIFESEKELSEGGELMDLDDIFNYIAREKLAPENAFGQTERIREALKKLEIMPQSHQDRQTSRYAGRGYKEP